MALHAEAFGVFAARHGLVLTPDLRGRLDGKRNRDIFPILFGRALPEEDLKRYTLEKEASYRELSHGRIRPVPGALRLLGLLEARGIPVAIATSAPAENVPHSLEPLGLLERFSVIVRSDEVPRGKPHPDVFLAAASRLGLPAEACLAFEDSPMGVLARAAGMTCVALTTSFSAEGLAAHGAHAQRTVQDFDEYLATAGAWLAAPLLARNG